MNISSTRLHGRRRVVLALAGAIGIQWIWGLCAGLAEEPLATLPHDDVRQVAFSPDGKTLVSAGNAQKDWWRRTIKFWELKTRKVRTTIEFPQFREEDIHKLVAAHPWVLKDRKNGNAADHPDESAKGDMRLLTSGELNLAPVKPNPAPAEPDDPQAVEDRAARWWKQTVQDRNVWYWFHDLAYSPDGRTIAVSFELMYPNPFPHRDLDPLLHGKRKRPKTTETEGATGRRARRKPSPLATKAGVPRRRLSITMIGLYDAHTGKTRAITGFDTDGSDITKRSGLDPNDLFSSPVLYPKNYPPHWVVAKGPPPIRPHSRLVGRSSPRGSNFAGGSGVTRGRVSFSPDGKLVAGGDKSGIVRIWDLDGTLQTTLDGHIFGVKFLSFLPAGWYNAYRAQREKTGTGYSKEGIAPDRGGRDYPQQSLGSSGPFDLLTVDGHTTFRIWNTKGRLLGQWQPPEARRAISLAVDRDRRRWEWDYRDRCWQYGSECLGLSPDGGTVVCRKNMDRGPRAELWLLDLATGQRQKLKQHPLMKHVERLASAAFSPDGRTLALGGMQDRRIILWELSERTPRKMLDGAGGPVRCLAFSPDGKVLASTAYNGIELWSLAE